MVGRKALLLAALGAALVSEADAARVKVTAVDRPQPGWLRIGLRYSTKGEPHFRLVPLCRAKTEPGWVVSTAVKVAKARRQATLDLREDFAWLADRRGPCMATGLAVELLEGAQVAASARVPVDLPEPRPLDAPPPPEPVREASPLGVSGQKLKAPQTRMSQAGVTWALNDRLSVHLSYERTAYAPTMSRDHDDGIMTGVRLGF